MFTLHPEQPQHAAAIDQIVNQAFGPDRLQKTVYKLRQNVPHIAELAFVALDDNNIVWASIRYWPIMIAAKWPAVLLGPLAVHPDRAGQGMGKALMRYSLERARLQGHGCCILVGDRPYYAPFGFAHAAPYGLELPGPVDPDRFQVKELYTGAMTGVHGLIGCAGTHTQIELSRS